MSIHYVTCRGVAECGAVISNSESTTTRVDNVTCNTCCVMLINTLSTTMINTVKKLKGIK